MLGLVASGKSNKEVADELFISIKTVETHKSHILEKLGVRNIIETYDFVPGGVSSAIILKGI